MTRAKWILLVFVGLALSSWLVLSSRATTRQGVNFRVQALEIPLYLKLLDFFVRDRHYGEIAERITKGVKGDEEKVQAVFEWTRKHILPIPAGMPVMDDHVLNIIIRGYGSIDQAADVFATLSTYAGIPAFWTKVALPGSCRHLIMAFARLARGWTVLDPYNGVLFRNERGGLATVDELRADPSRAKRLVGAREYKGVPYYRFVEALGTVSSPAALRAEMQMPWPRLRYEFKGLLSTALGGGHARAVVQEPDWWEEC